MVSKRHKPQDTVTIVRQLETLYGEGTPRVDTSRQVQITEQTFYRRHCQYGGTGTARQKDLKRLQKKYDRIDLYQRSASILWQI